MSDIPALSIGLPVYNGERYLHFAIESLLNQTFTDFELVISDNASTDGTQDICQKFAQWDERVRYVREPENRGAAWNFNRVFHLSRAPLFKWAACDDACQPTFLQRCVEVLQTEPEVVLAFPFATAINAAGEVFDDREWQDSSGYVREELTESQLAHRRIALMSARPHVRFHYVIAHFFYCHEIYGVMRSDALRSTGMHRTYYGADKMLLAELALRGKFAEIAEPLFLWRRHPDQSMWVGDSTSHERFVSGQSQTRKLPGFVRFNGGYIKRSFESPLPLHEKLLCMTSVARAMFKNKKLAKLVRGILGGRSTVSPVVADECADRKKIPASAPIAGSLAERTTLQLPSEDANADQPTTQLGAKADLEKVIAMGSKWEGLSTPKQEVICQ